MYFTSKILAMFNNRHKTQEAAKGDQTDDLPCQVITAGFILLPFPIRSWISGSLESQLRCDLYPIIGILQLESHLLRGHRISIQIFAIATVHEDWIESDETLQIRINDIVLDFVGFPLTSFRWLRRAFHLMERFSEKIVLPKWKKAVRLSENETANT